jgi:hypothetical protein
VDFNSTITPPRPSSKSVVGFVGSNVLPSGTIHEKAPALRMIGLKKAEA